MNAQLKNDDLALGSVLVGSLPATLLTDDAPSHYTVEAVFSRKPERDEIAGIHGNRTRDLLSSRGYPTVELRVSDRRLEISNTNLDELRDGLAGLIAEHLAVISEEIRTERELAAGRFQDASQREQQRAAAVAVLADSVTFTREDHGAASKADVAVEERVPEAGALL